MPYTVELRFVLEDQFLQDVMTTMVESGSDALWYWDDFEMVSVKRREDEYHEVMEFSFRCLDGDGEEVRFTMTPLKVAKAIERTLSADDEALCGQVISEYIISGVKDNDAGDIDAEAADVIAQVATFGEVVYG